MQRISNETPKQGVREGKRLGKVGLMCTNLCFNSILCDTLS